MRIIRLEEADSTNSWISRNSEELTAPCMVMARKQSAGRGQRGNTWESEPNRNLTFSLYLRPVDFPAIRQFHLSEAFALGICDALRDLCRVEAKVKWPNDIYWNDKKICGILIEHSVGSKNIIRTIAGAGINLNQTEFLSDAPNPVSVKMITGNDTDIDMFAEKMLEIVMKKLAALDSEKGMSKIHDEFKRRMWRGDGEYHPFRDTATGCVFNGKITDVAPMGYLHIAAQPEDLSSESKLINSPAHQSDSGLRYAFKEVEFILQ